MIDDWFVMMIGLLNADAFSADLHIQSCFYSAVCCMIHYGKRKTCNCKCKSVSTIMPQCQPLQSKCHFDFIAPSGDNSSLGFAPQDQSKRRVQPFYSTGGPADASGCYGRCIPKTSNEVLLIWKEAKIFGGIAHENTKKQVQLPSYWSFISSLLLCISSQICCIESKNKSHIINSMLNRECNAGVSRE